MDTTPHQSISAVRVYIQPTIHNVLYLSSVWFSVRM
jgi:hypothetical protein